VVRVFLNWSKKGYFIPLSQNFPQHRKNPQPMATEELPLWYTCNIDDIDQEAIEAQLMIEWFENDNQASKEYLEKIIGKRVYLPFAALCSNTVVST
jgi:hypothetical protein